MSVPATTWQTVGPFFSIGLERLYCDTLAGPGVHGERVEISGRMLDGDGRPVPDGIIEIWQANSYGKYAHPEDKTDHLVEPDFSGYGRIPTDAEGHFRFTTVKPGRAAAPVSSDGQGGAENRLQAPHLAVSVFCRGLLLRLVTRIYFPDESSNSEDYVLNLVEPSRRGTLIAKKISAPDNMAQSDGGGLTSLEWNIILQGSGETVFFDC